MRTMGPFGLKIVRGLARFGLMFVHPIFKVQGRENIPKGGFIACCNHTSGSDGVWLVFGLRQREMVKIMVKAQVLEVPILKYMFRWFGFVGVRRGEGDITAIKTAMKLLKEGHHMMIFPEGTRVAHGAPRIQAKTGAVMLATRTGVPVLPVYIETKRHYFSKLHMVFGEPYHPTYEGRKPTSEELQLRTDELMDTIYGLEQRICK